MKILYEDNTKRDMRLNIIECNGNLYVRKVVNGTVYWGYVYFPNMVFNTDKMECSFLKLTQRFTTKDILEREG